MKNCGNLLKNLLVCLLSGGLSSGVFPTAPATARLTIVRRLPHTARVIVVAAFRVPARVFLGQRRPGLVVVLEAKEEILIFEVVVITYCWEKKMGDGGRGGGG